MRFAGLVILLCLAWLPACGGEDRPAAPPDDAYSRATQLSILGALPERGLRGRTIHADGRYEAWEQAEGAADRRRTRAFSVSADEVRALFDTLREVRFLDLEPSDRDPAAAYASGMELHGPAGAHRVWWARPSDAPSNLRSIPQAFARWEHAHR